MGSIATPTDASEGTDQVLKNGWFHTGDLAFQDESTNYYLMGRKHEMIKRGGERIIPREVEAALTSHTKILEAAIVGVPDVFWGQVIKAFVCLLPGEFLSWEEIIDYCKKEVAEYKCPEQVEFVDFLPKDQLGKVRKDLLLAGKEAQNWSL